MKTNFYQECQRSDLNFLFHKFRLYRVNFYQSLFSLLFYTVICTENDKAKLENKSNN